MEWKRNQGVSRPVFKSWIIFDVAEGTSHHSFEFFIQVEENRKERIHNCMQQNADVCKYMLFKSLGPVRILFCKEGA